MIEKNQKNLVEANNQSRNAINQKLKEIEDLKMVNDDLKSKLHEIENSHRNSFEQ